MKKLILIAILSTTIGIAQKTNTFLDRNFWKTKPKLSEVKALIEQGVSITEKNKHAMDGFCYAILENTNFEITKYIIETGIDLNVLTHDKRNYIFWAAYKNNLKLMKYLVSKGSKSDIIDSAGYSLIQFTAAVGNNNIDIYDYIISLGGDIKEIDKRGRNIATLYAKKLSNIKTLEYFKKKGINLKNIDKNRNTLFTYACNTKNKKILNKLIKLGFEYKTIKGASENAFTMATKYSPRDKNELTIELISYLEKLGFNPSFIATETGNNALHNIAFSSKDITIHNYFLKKGLKINSQNKKGNTPLINATYRNNKDVIKILLDNNADLTLKNNKGEDALLTAVRFNSKEVVEILLQNGANCNIVDNDGNDIYNHLILGVKDKKIDDFKDKLLLLKSKGMSINKSKGIIQMAIKKGKKAIIDHLISLEIDLNSIDKEGNTPLQVAVMCAKNTLIIKKLIDSGANKKIKTSLGESLFDLAKENELLTVNKQDISFLKY